MCASSPDAWNVATIGPRKPMSADKHGPGTAGWCRCTRSGCMLRNASAVRRAVTRPGAIGAIEPFDSHSTLGPTLTIEGSGGGPSHGATMRTSTPSFRSSRASPRIWPCTPPGRDIEYGDTIASFMEWSSLPLRAVARPVGLEEMPLLGRRPDQGFEPVRDLLGDALRVLAQAPVPFGVDRCPDVAEVPAAGAEVHRRR